MSTTEEEHVRRALDGTHSRRTDPFVISLAVVAVYMKISHSENTRAPNRTAFLLTKVQGVATEHQSYASNSYEPNPTVSVKSKLQLRWRVTPAISQTFFLFENEGDRDFHARRKARCRFTYYLTYKLTPIHLTAV